MIRSHFARGVSEQGDMPYSVVELSFMKGRVQSVSMRALCARIFAARAYETFFSGSKGHFNIGSFGPV